MGGFAPALLATLLTGVSEAAIHDGRWLTTVPRHHEDLWTKLTDAAEGKTCECTSLGTLDLTDASQFPSFCHSRATVLGSDTFDVEADQSRCHFKRCSAFADMKFVAAPSGRSTYSLLTGKWIQLLTRSHGEGIACEYVPDRIKLSDTNIPFPQACQYRAITLGADSFDAKFEDGAYSKCYFKRCKRFSDISFDDKFGAYDSFTVLGGDFSQITIPGHGKMASCTSRGELDIASADLPAAGSTDAPMVCVSKAHLLRADTFDVGSSKCFFKRCESLSSMAFVASDATGPHTTYSMLANKWSQITTASEGFSVECQQVDTLLLPVTSGFPQACYSKAMILSSDTFDAEPDGSACYFKKCGTFGAMSFTTRLGGRSTHTMLTGGWTELLLARDGQSPDCEFKGEYTPPSAATMHQACFTRALTQNANTVDMTTSPLKCNFKSCGSWRDITVSNKFGPRNSWTMAFPRVGADWGPCDRATCLDMHFLYTSKLLGRHLPVYGGGTDCDPDDAGGCFGGTARRVGFAKKKKADFAQRNESVLLLDLGGNTFGGSLWDMEEYPRGTPSTILMNMTPYDMCGFSPRDFITKDDDKSRAELVDSYMQRSCPYLLSNAEFQLAWSGFNSKIHPWVVKEMLNGWKVAFVALFPQQPTYGYTFSNNVIKLNKRSLLTQVLSGSYELALNRSRFVAELADVGEQFDRLVPHDNDVFKLSTLVSIDVLAALGEAKRQHPDVRASVLLVSGSQRLDQVQWLAENGGFDVILRETDWPPVTIKNKVNGKEVLMVGSETLLGLGHVKVRLRENRGVELFEFSSDIPLDAAVPSDPAIAGVLSDMYKGIRAKLAQPFGSITNSMRGGHRGGEEPPSMNQCYYMDCNAGVTVGNALLWKARSQNLKVDVSLYNLGGFRAPLTGDANGVVAIGHCRATLKFQNFLKVFSIPGRDLYEILKHYLVMEERGLMAGGVRIAYHEPCHEYVWSKTGNTDFTTEGWNGNAATPPGSTENIAKCKANGNVEDVNVRIIQVEVFHVDWEKCADFTDCTLGVWRPLEKATTYNLVSTDFIRGEHSAKAFEPMDISLGTDADALCGYIKAKSPLQIESWETFRDRGQKQYATAKEGWDAGLRMASVATSESMIEAAPLCPLGMHLPSGAKACEKCPAGKHSEVQQSGADSLAFPVCRQCAEGFFANESGMGSCQPCPAGQYASGPGRGTCDVCKAGFMSDTGARECASCPEGTFSGKDGSDRCEPCPVGRYADERLLTACKPCGKSLTTKSLYSRSEDECVCPEGHYRPLAGNLSGNVTNVECKVCEEGVECPMGSDLRFLGANHTLKGGHAPSLKPLYWSSAEDPMSVFGCSSRVKCPGGPPGDACAPGLGGRACEKCQASEEGRKYYWDGTRCARCWGSSLLFPVIPVLMAPLLVILAYRATRAPLADWDAWTGAIAVQGYIFLSHYQILNLMKNAATRMPASVLQVFEFWGWTNNVLSLFEANCNSMDSFRSRTYVGALLPTGIVIISLLTMGASWILSSRLQKPEMKMEHYGMQNVIGNFLFTFFTGVVGQALSIFNCAPNPSGLETMKEERSIVCWQSDEWREVFFVGIITSIIYFAVVVAAYARAVLIAPCNGNFKDSDFQWRWKFLFVKFRADVYWFGIICLAKSSLINIGIVILKTDAAVLYWIKTVVMAYTGFIVAFMPYRYRLANLTELCCSVSLIYSCSFLVRFTDPGENTDNVVTFVLIAMSFLPTCVAVPTVCLIIRNKFMITRDDESEEMAQLFAKIKNCCAALVFMPDHVGEEMMSDIGEWDRHLFRSYIRLINAEVFGIGTYRLSSGTISIRYGKLARESQEMVRATRVNRVFTSDAFANGVPDEEVSRMTQKNDATGPSPRMALSSPRGSQKSAVELPVRIKV